MKKLLLILFCVFPKIIFAQDFFVDKATGQEYLFLGSLSLDSKKAKVFENDQIRWKDLDSMEHTGMLNLPEFLAEIFTHNLQFELNGYEPFWHAVITRDKIVYSDTETGTDITYPIRITNSLTLGYGIYFMFSSPNKEIYGLIYSTGYTKSEKQQLCEFDLSEEASLYCAYLSINQAVYKGCATIQPKSVLKLQEKPETTKLRTYSIDTTTEKEFLFAQKRYKNKILCDTAAFKKANGILKLPISGGNKPYVIFRDTSANEDETSVVKYRYWGQFEKVGLYVVSAAFWEDVEYYLVDKISGSRTTLWEAPAISPDEKFIANLSMPYGFEGVPNGIQLWKINDRGNDLTNTMLDKFLEIDQQAWMPEKLVWDTNSSLILKVAPVHSYDKGGGTIAPEDYYYLRLKWKED